MSKLKRTLAEYIWRRLKEQAWLGLGLLIIVGVFSLASVVVAAT